MESLVDEVKDDIEAILQKIEERDAEELLVDIHMALNDVLNSI